MTVPAVELGAILMDSSRLREKNGPRIHGIVRSVPELKKSRPGGRADLVVPCPCIQCIYGIGGAKNGHARHEALMPRNNYTVYNIIIITIGAKIGAHDATVVAEIVAGKCRGHFCPSRKFKSCALVCSLASRPSTSELVAIGDAR